MFHHGTVLAQEQFNESTISTYFFTCASCNLISAGQGSNNTNQNNSTNLNNTTDQNNTTNQNNTTQSNNSTTNQNNTTNQSNNSTTNNITQTTNNGTIIPTDYERVVVPGSDYFGSTEKFNAYYTDPSWTPKRIVYVSMESSNSNFNTQAYDSPIDLSTALLNLRPGDLVFVKATSTPIPNVNIRLNTVRSGTFASPIVFYGERKPNGDLAVEFECETLGSDLDASCFNLEGSSYVVIDGFSMKGGTFGVRAVGPVAIATPAGNMFVNNEIFEQGRACIFSSGMAWAVVESNRCYDGNHGGIGFGGGGDLTIVRYNELYGSAQVDFQIDGNPETRCMDQGIEYSDIECYGSTLDGDGKGISEFFTVSDNFFHDGNSQGPNLTSLKNSKVSNNIFGPYLRHGVSFWQVTTEPNLGSSNNEITKNLFVGFRGHMRQFVENSDTNTFSDNVMLALNVFGSATDPALEVIQTDPTTTNNTYSGNFYFGGAEFGHAFDPSETYEANLPENVFEMAPFARTGHPEDWTPKTTGSLGGWTPPVLSPFPSPYSR